MDLCERAENPSRHPWETARAAALRAITRRHWPRNQARRVLDVGCADGFAARFIVGGGAVELVHGVDVNLSAEDLSRYSGAGLTCYNAYDALRQDYTDLLLLDVLEHLPDDVGFLANLTARRLSPGGLVFITVPAFPHLWGGHDEYLRHCRRYRRRGLRLLLRGAGLRIIAEGSLFFSLLLVRHLELVLERLPGRRRRPRHGIGRWEGGAALTQAMHAALCAENRVLDLLGRTGALLPGLSLWTVARKP